MLLSETTWRAQHRLQLDLVQPFVAAHQERRKLGQKHPVWDFLFEYYGFKPSLLLRFSPGLGIEIEGGDEFLARREWRRTEGGVALDPAQFPVHRLHGAREVLQILVATQNRPPRFDCFGLHEWAMVYRAPETRHAQPLRLSSVEAEALVEAHPIRCSHFDAVRFFTPDALPLNTLSPTFDARAHFEQGGCIHANMDVLTTVKTYFLQQIGRAKTAPTTKLYRAR